MLYSFADLLQNLAPDELKALQVLLEILRLHPESVAVDESHDSGLIVIREFFEALCKNDR